MYYNVINILQKGNQMADKIDNLLDINDLIKATKNSNTYAKADQKAAVFEKAIQKESQKKSKQISIYLTEEENEMLENFSKARYMSKNAAVRMFVVEGLKEHK